MMHLKISDFNFIAIAVVIYSNIKTSLASSICYYYPYYPSVAFYYSTICSDYCCSATATSAYDACCYYTYATTTTNGTSSPWWVALIVLGFVGVVALSVTCACIQKNKRRRLNPVMPIQPVVGQPVGIYPPQTAYPMAQYPAAQYPATTPYPPPAYPGPASAAPQPSSAVAPNAPTPTTNNTNLYPPIKSDNIDEVPKYEPFANQPATTGDGSNNMPYLPASVAVTQQTNNINQNQIKY